MLSPRPLPLSPLSPPPPPSSSYGSSVLASVRLSLFFPTIAPRPVAHPAAPSSIPTRGVATQRYYRLLTRLRPALCSLSADPPSSGPARLSPSPPSSPPLVRPAWPFQ
ncbi:hypothetical protein NL676_003799 [Syzygium grande]|nr:hypothetical protein NL676_003799 [Syzygium grande]